MDSDDNPSPADDNFDEMLEQALAQQPEPVSAEDQAALAHGLEQASRIAQKSRPRESAALAEGSTLGPYRLEAVLGQGGMGTVYRAIHTRLEKSVAVKVLPADQLQTPDAVARFSREMKAVGRLDHPNIVRATDADEEHGMQYLVMELVQGMDLSRLIRERGPLPTPDACEIIRQAALGLEHAHRHGLVHRDIKPSNLLLTSDGQVKILDLGLALLHDASPTGDLTATGQIMGTADYMAPEQGNDTSAVDIRADIYSLGCTLYHLLVGEPPFGGPEYVTPLNKIVAHVQKPVPPIRARRPDVPPAVVQVIDRMLAKQPQDRYATPEELATALIPCSKGCDLTAICKQRQSQVNVVAREDMAAASVSTTRPPTLLELVRSDANAFRWALAGLSLATLLLMAALGVYLTRGTVQAEPVISSTANDPLAQATPIVSDVTQSQPDWQDLLELVDPRRDAVEGEWTWDGESLISADAPFARLQIPYNPPADYDFRVTFVARSNQAPGRGQGEVFQWFSTGQLAARWSMWCRDYHHFGFVWDADSFESDDNRTFARLDEALQPGREYISLVEVRRGRVTASLRDSTAPDEMLVHRIWDSTQVSSASEPPFRMPNPQRLGLGAYESVIEFRRVEVRERPVDSGTTSE